MTIEAKDVSVTQPGQPQLSVSGVTLTIKAGETVCFVGESESGKTTLVKALMGLRHHDTGTININGTSIASYQPSSVHKRMSGSFNRYPRLGLSLGGNVGVGQDNDTFMSLDDPRCRRALRLAGVGGILDNQKLEPTLCEETGHYPSSYALLEEKCHQLHLTPEERDSVNLARTFMRLGSADLLVIKVEETSAVDDLFQNIYMETGKKDTRATTIIITSSLRLMPMVDKVAWIDNGVRW